MTQILIASHNPGKIGEYTTLLQPLGFEVVTLQDLGIDHDVEEDGVTFEENARKKVIEYHRLSGLPAINDDGGLEVEYLNGEPGLHSRRWLGYKMTDEELIQELMKRLEGVPKEQRNARFRAAVAFCDKDGKVTVSEGILEGRIALEPSEDRAPGYPFRSVFELLNGQLHLDVPDDSIDSISHRHKALQHLLPVLMKSIS